MVRSQLRIADCGLRNESIGRAVRPGPQTCPSKPSLSLSLDGSLVRRRNREHDPTQLVRLKTVIVDLLNRITAWIYRVMFHRRFGTNRPTIPHSAVEDHPVYRYLFESLVRSGSSTSGVIATETV
jgi:hypothetical protein